jgi:hypothetical protein
MAPGERIGLRGRRNHSVPHAGMFRLGERLRAGLALLQVQAPSGGRVSEELIA